MTKAYVNFGHNATNAPSSPWNNHLFGDSASLQQLSSDLLDDTGASTGWTVDVTDVFLGINGSFSTATADTGDWQHEVFDYAHRTENGGTGEITIGGLTSGDSYSLEVAGYNSSSRDCQFTVNGDTSDYVFTSDAANPAGPITFTGTVPVSGEISISVTTAATGSFYGYINGFTLETTAAGLTIDSTDASMQRGTNFELVCSGATTAPTTGNTTLSNGNDTLTPTSVTGSDPYTLTFPVGDLTKQVDATGYDWTLEITP